MAIVPVDVLSHAAIAFVYAGKLILLTIGLNMTYSVLKFSNFSHAEWVTWGMFSSWWLLQILAFLVPWDAEMGFIINNILIQATFAFFMVGILGILSEILVFGRLRDLKASARSFTVASIGIGLVVRNLLSMVFGDYPQPVSSPELPFGLEDILVINITLTNRDPILGTQSIILTSYKILIILISIITVLLIDYIFKHTKFGIAMRATSDSIDLAQVSGINTRQIIFITWFIAAGVTGFGAAFVRATQGRFGTMDGFSMLLPIFAVVILGGVGSFRGGIVSAFIISYAREISAIILTEFQKKPYGLQYVIEDLLGFTISLSPGYMDGVGFVVLILVLLFRPQGIFGSVEAIRARV
ncbi:MAG: branched-chain amino acid ABC transporter permease [Candidatus Heimdallarchaeota archaeon]|nr:MAG: branched-chain amino acid ABC transporter permease [Candidatus Heimdallarchaeota archaeon]